MQLSLVLSFFLATGLARCQGRSRNSRQGPPRLGFSRSGPPRPGQGLTRATKGKIKPPPPPTDRGTGALLTNRQGQEEAKYVWDENCQDNRPPFEEGRWIRVTYEECPVAFDDPRFSHYRSFCRYN